MLRQERRDAPPRIMQVRLVMMQDDEIIHIANVVFHAQLFLDEMIQLVQIDIPV